MNNRRSSLLFCLPKTSRFADGKKLPVVCNVCQSINTKLSTTFYGVKTKQTGKKYAYHMMFSHANTVIIILNPVHFVRLFGKLS